MKPDKKRKARIALMRAAIASPELAEEHNISPTVAQAFLEAEKRRDKRAVKSPENNN